MLLSQFPGASQADCFTPNEIKKIFYHSMPVRWRTNFINSGQNLQSTTLDNLRTYMVQQEMQTNAHRQKSRENNKEKQKGKSNHTSSSRSRHFKRSSNQSKDSNSSKEKKRKLNNDDDCPIHGSSHKWGQCHQNQYGNNFKPKRSSPSGSTQSSQGRSHRQSYFNGPPNQVQVYSNESRPPASDASTDSRSLKFQRNAHGYFPIPHRLS